MGSSRSSAKPEPAPSAGAVAAVLDAVASSLRRLDADDRVVVAFSGGVDSAVLLDAAARVLPRERVVTWHVHHKLQAQADDWLAHCEREAARIGVRFGATRLESAPSRGVNLEGWARDERYRALWDAVAQMGSRALLTAHHADDQLETILMRLARGSGPAALAGMAAAQQRAGGWLLRPLLSIGREQIVACARERGLQWIDDPMNEDTSFLRVTLRTRVIPELERAVPSLRENVLRSADWLRESGDALRELAERDLHEAGVSPAARSIDKRALAALPPARRDLAVRRWFETLGAPMPGRARLAAWVSQLLLADSAHADFVHEGWRFRRYRDRISVEETDTAVESAPPPAFAFRWSGEREISLPGWGGVLRFEHSTRVDALAADWLAAQALEVRAARSGQRLRPRAHGPSRTLKNLFQERGIAPRLRAMLPALHADGRLIYVAGIGMDRSRETAAVSDARVEIEWRADAAADPCAPFCDDAPPV